MTEEMVSLREYLERLVDAHAIANDQRHDADQRALIEARRGLEQRLELLNELRSDVVKDRALLLPRDAYDAAHSALEILVDERANALSARVAILETWKAKATGIGAVLVLLSGVIGAALFKAFS